MGTSGLLLSAAGVFCFFFLSFCAAAGVAQANAIVNQVFMLSVNAAGPIGAGGSIVCDPEGTVIADLPTTDPGVIRVDVDLDVVTRVREVGTEGFNRMWSQMAPDDPVIDLPIYKGRIDPTRWQPRGAS